MDEVNLNDPLNWYISDAMDEYIGHLDSGAAKKMIARNRAYSNLLQAVKDAADHLEATGHKDRAALAGGGWRSDCQDCNSSVTRRYINRVPKTEIGY